MIELSKYQPGPFTSSHNWCHGPPKQEKEVKTIPTAIFHLCESEKVLDASSGSCKANSCKGKAPGSRGQDKFAERVEDCQVDTKSHQEAEMPWW